MPELTKDELDTVIDYLFTISEEALENGSCVSLREAMGNISDICNPDSLLDVNIEAETVEVSGWESNEENGDDEPEE